MSIDLEWHKLDSSLSSTLVDVLNKQLANTNRPSFIGPIEVTALDFGTASPDVELVDMCDIYRDFLEDDEENEDAEPETVKVNEEADDDEGFEWVSRKAARARSLLEEVPAYHPMPPHMRYGHGPVTDMFASTPNLYTSRAAFSPALTDLRSSFPYATGYASPMFRPPLAMGPFASVLSSRLNTNNPPSPVGNESSSSVAASDDPAPGTTPSPQNNQPNLQLHLHVSWHSNLRITFTTSLLINYPSPMFMSLPIKLSVTGLVFNGEIAVAYEGERRRIHLCILDDLDPYGPLAGERSKRDTPPSAVTPAEHDDDAAHATGLNASRPGKPLPVGQRLLPSVFIESEIGQADKHVLKNVTRVERFIQDVFRKTVEEELVFPNFHTIVLPDPQTQ
jgi:mitochondrial distribution and morphology protein 12